VYRPYRNSVFAWLLTLTLIVCADNLSAAQKKTKKKTPAAPAPVTELTRLREEFVKATNDYKASLEKLIVFYEANVKKAEDKLAVSQKLFADQLIAKKELDESQQALDAAKAKVAETRRQMTGADDQIASVLVEQDADEQIKKNLSLAKQRLGARRGRAD
jgi:hypothetical protein